MGYAFVWLDRSKASATKKSFVLGDVIKVNLFNKVLETHRIVERRFLLDGILFRKQ